LGADPATTADGLWHGLSEGLRESHSTGQALLRKDLYHTNRIPQLQNQALFCQAPS